MALEQIDTLYRVARRLARDTASAEDLVQETYMRALRAWESFQLESYGIKPWLVRILQNVHLSRSQRESRQPTALEQGQLESVNPSFALPAGLNNFEGMDEQLVRAIDKLAPEYQVVLMLWAVDELSYKEIAHACEIPIGTVMSRLYRARQQLSEQLRDFAVREGIIRE